MSVLNVHRVNTQISTPAHFGLVRFIVLAAWLAISTITLAQPRTYIGFVYPAGGQQGTTFQLRVGGQGLDDVSGVLISGSGVTATVAENYRRLNNQELQLLNEQLRVLRRNTLSDSGRAAIAAAESTNTMSDNTMMMMSTPADEENSAAQQQEAARKLMERIEKRTAEFVPTPAAPSIASLVIVEVKLAADAEPGERELRLVTWRGVSNPLSFHVGQVPEFTRKPMQSATLQVLGKEAQALRKRLSVEAEERVTLPCTANGQIASGEINRYRFAAQKGQRLVITTLGRQLVPFIADAVPGWFQPVLALYNADGKEVVYGDDYRFKPDPTIFYEVPKDGEYVFTIRDSLYRGREDFVYRITAGELPFITSIFPLGGPAHAPGKPAVKGWNLDGAALADLPKAAERGICLLTAGNKGFVSNRVPFAVDVLPEILEQEPNNTAATAQALTLPVIVNGRIDRPDDWDVYRFTGTSNQPLVAEVIARRLDSPLDSVIKLTDAAGRLIAFNDDHEDLAAGINTHQADSYLLARLPADGEYCVHVGDAARQGGEEYAYRLRLSAPSPDFDLRVVPSSLSLRSKATANVTVYAQRRDGFVGAIKLALKNPPAGFSASPVTMSATQAMVRMTLKTSLVATEEPATVTIEGTAGVGGEEIARIAVPAEDRMQAFLWRQLVPAKDLKVLVFDPGFQPPPKRIARLRPAAAAPSSAVLSSNAVEAVAARGSAGLVAATNGILATNGVAGTNAAGGTNLVAAAKPKFTKQQVAARLKQLKILFEEGMLTDEFYGEKVAECEADQ